MYAFNLLFYVDLIFCKNVPIASHIYFSSQFTAPHLRTAVCVHVFLRTNIRTRLLLFYPKKGVFFFCQRTKHVIFHLGFLCLQLLVQE